MINKDITNKELLLQALYDKKVTALEKLTIKDTLLINNIIEEYYRNTSKTLQD